MEKKTRNQPTPQAIEQKKRLFNCYECSTTIDITNKLPNALIQCQKCMLLMDTEQVCHRFCFCGHCNAFLVHSLSTYAFQCPLCLKTIEVACRLNVSLFTPASQPLSSRRRKRSDSRKVQQTTNSHLSFSLFFLIL